MEQGNNQSDFNISVTRSYEWKVYYDIACSSSSSSSSSNMLKWY